MRKGTLVCLVLIIPVFSCFTTAIPSGLTYLDSTWLDGDFDSTKFVELTDEFIIGVHDDELVIYDKETRDLVNRQTLLEMSAIKASPDGNYLAVNKAFTLQEPKSLLLVNLTDFSILQQRGSTDTNSKDLTWHPTENFIAAPGKDGDVVILRRSDMSVKNTLGGVHHVEISCLDYREDGEYLITGDESGRYAIWSQNGSLIDTYRNLPNNEGIVDCKWSPDGQNFILIGDEGNVFSRSFTGSLNNQILIDGANEVIFSTMGHIIHIGVENNTFKGIVSINFDSFQNEYLTHFFHRLNDIEIIDDEFGRLIHIFVASNTGEIAIYQKNIFFDGYLSPGADHDNDMIPDTHDVDDDGDGIIDEWDNDFGCDAPEGTPCSLYPDLGKIRNVNFEFSEETLIVTDEITLPTYFSSDIRNYSRNSMATDQVISSNEQKLFSDAICNNFIQGDLIDEWKSSLRLSTGELGDAEISCNVLAGLEGIKVGDSVTQINFEIVLRFELDSEITYPLEFAIEKQPKPTTGTISWVAPAHPMSVEVSGDKVIGQEIAIWRNDGMELMFTIEEKKIDEASSIDAFVGVLINPITIILVIIFIPGLVYIFIKRVKNYDLNLDDYDEGFSDDEDDDEEDDDEEIEKDDYDIQEDMPEEFQEDAHEEDFEEEFQEEKKVSSKKKSVQKATNIGYPGEMLSGDVSTTKKRRVSTDNINKDGPIMKTKRKRLVSSEDSDSVVMEEEKPVIKKRTVKQATEDNLPRKKTVKKTDSEAQIEPNDEMIIEEKESIQDPVSEKSETDTIEKSKRRKPVRRKSTKDDVGLDEKEMQDNLLDDFTKE